MLSGQVLLACLVLAGPVPDAGPARPSVSGVAAPAGPLRTDGSATPVTGARPGGPPAGPAAGHPSAGTPRTDLVAGAHHPGPSILLVTFDTLRRDHVSAYGAERLTTPRIDALAAAGIRFTDCQATISVTGPSHGTMLSGLYPQTHGAFRNGIAVKAGTWMIQGALKDAGWRTGAFVAGWTLKAKQAGLDPGFSTWDEDGMDERYSVVNLMRRADGVTDATLAWFDSWKAAADADRPWFAFVHYFDPHEPYTAPTPAPAANPGSKGQSGAKLRQRLVDYDGEIAWTDAQFGRLLDGLAERGQLDDTVIIFTADHGQSFGEHGEGGPEGAHGRRTYQSTLGVPLIISWPGRVGAGRTTSVPASHVDLAPTLAAIAGLRADSLPAELPGSSLHDILLRPDAEPPWGGSERVRYAVAFPGAVGNKWNLFRWFQNKDVDQATPIRAAAVVGTTKIIIDPKRALRVEAYDLAKDPHETKPLEDRSRSLDSWGPRILEWYDRTRVDLVDVAPDPADLEKLRALGYVGGE